MVVLKEGELHQKLIRFKCAVCGCVFEANQTEYTIKKNRYSAGNLAYCKCPTCKTMAHCTFNSCIKYVNML